MNVFADFHHSALFYSFYLLFEKRFGGNLYRPVGMEWRERNYWHIFNHPATAAQYLSLDQTFRPVDGSLPLNLLHGTKPTHYEVDEQAHGYIQKAVTLEQFNKLPIDVVIASIPEHIEPFKRLCAQHPNKPKLVFHVGNTWDYVEGVANVMASAKIHTPESVHKIEYHQEFDTSLFTVGKYKGSKDIVSFVNCFDTQQHLAQDWQLFQAVEKLMTDYTFRAYGGGCRDGSCHGVLDVAETMQEARFIWHTKAGGDGFGHVLHNAYCSGTPVIIKKDYYRGKLAEPLIEDGVTSICIDNLSPQEVVEKINHYSVDDRYYALCKGASKRFEEFVNFDSEAVALKTFFETLV